MSYGACEGNTMQTSRRGGFCMSALEGSRGVEEKMPANVLVERKKHILGAGLEKHGSQSIYCL